MPDLRAGEVVKDFPKFDAATYFDPEFDHNLVLRDDLRQMVIDTKCFAVRKDDWKLISVPGEGGRIFRLFDLASDPECRRDRFAEFPEIVARLRRKLRSTLDESPRCVGADRIELPHGHWNSESDLRDSAVLAILVERDGVDHLVFNGVATTFLTTPGRSAFPAVRARATKTRFPCAVRETCGEMGIPADSLDLLGRLPDRVSIAGFRVAPFVARLVRPVPMFWRPPRSPRLSRCRARISSTASGGASPRRGRSARGFVVSRAFTRASARCGDSPESCCATS